MLGQLIELSKNEGIHDNIIWKTSDSDVEKYIKALLISQFYALMKKVFLISYLKPCILGFPNRHSCGRQH